MKQPAMTHAAGVGCEMRCTLPATLAAAEEFFGEFQVFLQTTPTPLQAADRFSVELLLREALTNAVLHGCHADAAQRVRCSVRMKNRRLLIAIDDEGDGFDWRATWDKSADLSDCSGRGVEILRTYASRVRYNAKGNAVIILKRFCEKNSVRNQA